MARELHRLGGEGLNIGRLRLGDREEDLLEVALLGRDAEEIDARADQPAHHFGRFVARRADEQSLPPSIDRPARGERRLGDVERRGVDLEAAVGAQQIGDGRFADDLALVDDRDAVADLLDLVEEVAGEEDRLALVGGEAADQLRASPGCRRRRGR